MNSKLDDTLTVLKNEIESLLMKNDMLDHSKESFVTVNHDDLGGSISVSSFVLPSISNMLRSEVKDEIGSDVFMLSCSAVFTLNKKMMKINCSIVNEDGIPVNVVDAPGVKKITEDVSMTRTSIYNIFKSI